MAAADFSAAASRRVAAESLISMAQETSDRFPAHTLPFRPGSPLFSSERVMAAADFSAAACFHTYM